LCSSLLSKNVKIKIYIIIILPVVLYEYETLLHTLREECRLRVFSNRVLRRIFGPKRDEVTGEWRRVHIRSFILCVSHHISFRRSNQEELRWAEHVARMGERKSAYRVLVGKLEGRRPLKRARHGWEDTIKMDLKEVGWGHRLDQPGCG
jgi:hypothetical protein